MILERKIIIELTARSNTFRFRSCPLWTQAADWTEYPQPKSEDLPGDVSALVTVPVEEEPPSEPITDLAARPQSRRFGKPAQVSAARWYPSESRLRNLSFAPVVARGSKDVFL